MEWTRVLLIAFAFIIMAQGGMSVMLALRVTDERTVSQIRRIQETLNATDARFDKTFVPISSLYIYLDFYDLTEENLPTFKKALSSLPTIPLCFGLKEIQFSGTSLQYNAEQLHGVFTEEGVGRLKLVARATAAVFKAHGLDTTRYQDIYRPYMDIVVIGPIKRPGLPEMLRNFDPRGALEGARASFGSIDLLPSWRWNELNRLEYPETIGTKQLGSC